MKELLSYSMTLHALYVEDNEDARTHTCEMLKRFFGTVTVACDGKEGKEKFDAGKFDIVLTDINMPKMNGIEMISYIKASDSNIPILVLSAHNETEYFIDTIRLGIDGYLLKPLDIQQFINTLQKSVEKILLHKKVEEYQRRLETLNAELEQKVQERTAELEHRLYHDALTELKNHTAMIRDIAQSDKGAMLLIDLDRFQTYNELYGMHAGNKILQAFTRLLLTFNRDKGYTLYRAYGDGFALFKSMTSDYNEHFDKEVQTLLRLLEGFFVYVDEIGENLDIDATIGVSIGESNPFECANMALRHAKKQKKPIMFFTEEMDMSRQLANDLHWQSEIKKALEHDNIIPVFQGLANHEQKIVKYEALIRLVQNEGGQRKLITPFHFLESAKKTKQYEKLTRIMIEKSFSIMQPLTCDFSINLSFEDISNPVLILFLEEALQKYGVGHRLIIEILESETVSDYELVSSVIMRLRKQAIRIAIDDFGSGFSNFEHILRLNPDYIKIDGSLIKNILQDKHSLTLVKAIAEFSKELNIKVIAEFVSSKEIFETLKNLSIDEYQGYYFSTPSEQINEIQPI